MIGPGWSPGRGRGPQGTPCREPGSCPRQQSGAERRGQLPGGPLPGCPTQSRSSGNWAGCAFYFRSGFSIKTCAKENHFKLGPPHGSKNSRVLRDHGKHFLCVWPLYVLEGGSPSPSARRRSSHRKGSLTQRISRKWPSRSLRTGPEPERSCDSAGGGPGRPWRTPHSSLWIPGVAFCSRWMEVPMMELPEKEKTCSG